MVIEPQFVFAENFVDGRAVVGDSADIFDGTFGLIDTEGNMIVPYVYRTIMPFREGRAAVQVGGYMDAGEYVPMRMGFIDRYGNEVVPLIYMNVTGFNEGLAGVTVGELRGDRDAWRAGIIDRYGNEVVPLVYDWVGPVSEGYAWMRRDGKFGLLQVYDPGVYGNVGGYAGYDASRPSLIWLVLAFLGIVVPVGIVVGLRFRRGVGF